MAEITRKQLEKALAAASYPADKDALVATVERAGVDPDADVHKAVRSLPPSVEYGNFAEVAASARVKMD